MPVEKFAQCRPIAQQGIVDVADKKPSMLAARLLRLDQLADQLVIDVRMSFPVVGGDCIASRRCVSNPFASIGDNLETGTGNRRRILGTDQKTVLAALHDIVGASTIGSNYRQTRSSRFEQGQTKWLIQCWVYENAATLPGKSIIGRDVFGLVRFGIGDLPVQIVRIDRADKLLADRPTFRLEIGNPAPATGNDDQVRTVLKRRVGRICVDKPNQIFLSNRTGDGQNDGLFRIS